MRSVLSTLPAAALLLAATAAGAAPVAIDLGTWSERGPAANGNWVVASGGTSVLQTINGDPTFFVSGVDQINTTLRGKIKVETTSDDDLIGFVFGFKSPAAGGSDMDFLLLDWKQTTQSSGGGLSKEGFALSRVNGTITNYIPGFWSREDSTGFDNLATNYGDTLGWVDNVEYDFTILYQEDRIRIDIAGGAFGSGQTIFDIAGTFQAGSFGFYNYSQSQVRYSGITEEDTPPPPPGGTVPEPSTAALAALALGLAARRRRAAAR